MGKGVGSRIEELLYESPITNHQSLLLSVASGPFFRQPHAWGAKVFPGGWSVTQPVGLGSRVIAPLVRLNFFTMNQ
jgi:hypothetical protein